MESISAPSPPARSSVDTVGPRPIQSLRRHYARQLARDLPSVCFSVIIVHFGDSQYRAHQNSSTAGFEAQAPAACMQDDGTSSRFVACDGDAVCAHLFAVENHPRRVRVRSKPSSIAGTGVFAAEDIAKGTCVFFYGGELHDLTPTIVEELHQLHGTKDVGYLFKVSHKKILDGFSSPSLARFANHSCAV